MDLIKSWSPEIITIVLGSLYGMWIGFDLDKFNSLLDSAVKITTLIAIVLLIALRIRDIIKGKNNIDHKKEP